MCRSGGLSHRRHPYAAGSAGGGACSLGAVDAFDDGGAIFSIVLSSRNGADGDAQRSGGLVRVAWATSHGSDCVDKGAAGVVTKPCLPQVQQLIQPLTQAPPI